MSLGTSNFEMIFALLIKIVAFHMQINMVNVGDPGLWCPVRIVFSWQVSSLLDAALYQISELRIGKV